MVKSQTKKNMRFLDMLSLLDFTILDEQIEKMRELRNSYRTANIEHYGHDLAEMLDN